MRTGLVVLAVLTGCNNDFQINKSVSELHVSPGFIDLGVVAVGDTAEAIVTLAAENGQIQVQNVDVLNVEGTWFALAEDTAPTLASDEVVDVLVRYTPEDEGLHWARVTVYTDAAKGAEQEVQVRAEAVRPTARLYPSILDFGPVQAGTTETRELTVVNEGRAPLTLSDVALSDATFAVVDSLPIEIPVGERADLLLSFGSEDEAEHTGLATLDLGPWTSIDDVTLRANACSTAPGDLYDSDSDGYSFCASDCDDFDAAVNPAGVESCNGVDDDCDGGVDEGTGCVDDDGDGWTEDDGDCNDGDASLSPGLTEVPGNGLDDDCDGVADDGALDLDGDGYSEGSGDCDDGDPTAYPGAEEHADGVDDDCDGRVDDGTDAYDDDGDGWSEDDGDCDDSDTGASPGGSESADWVDNDCDGLVDEGTSRGDDDGDGWSEVGGDCNDANASVNPGEVETTGNGVDDDCDGVTR